ncbi:partial Inner membrane protein CreD, partial [uncultured bacterium]
MQKSLWIKAAVVFALMLALLVPLGMIDGLVSERAGRQAQVVEDIAASSAGSQHLFGPVLVVPYNEHWQETVEVSQNGKLKKRLEERVEGHEVRFLPEQLNINGNLTPETKHRGLFQVRSYVLDSEFKGRFAIPPGIGHPQPLHKGRIVFGTPYVAVTVADMRGVLAAPGVDWNGKRFGFEQGPGLYFTQTTGMHATVDALTDSEAATDIPFAFTLKLRGLENLDLVPAGRQTHVALTSPWPHPGFHGRFLPDPQAQEIGPEGFRVAWSVNALASNVADSLRQCKELNCFDSFGVRLVDPVNIYSLSDRATKYGFLFVGLTFAAIFLFEVL